jgi:hypothetical protein
MRPILPPWALFLFAAILFMGGLFWVRAHPGEKHNPLEESVEELSHYLGMEVEAVPARAGPGGLLVKAIRPDSMAERIGVKVGERVAAVGDRSVWHAVQLQQLISDEMSRRGSCTLMLAKDQVYRCVTLGFVPVPPPPVEHEHHH